MEIMQIKDAAGMSEAAAAVLKQVAVRNTGAVVVALSGDLGAGKTTLTQALAAALGITETITSPTYVVMKRYELPAPALGRFDSLVHIDAYRIEDVDEMRVLKFPELLAEKDTIICIEWPEHIAALIPDGAITVAIELAGTGRKITIT